MWRFDFSMFGFGRKQKAPGARGDGAIGKASLFDEEFQRRLETLAIVSRKVFAGRQRAERRSKKRGSGIEFADHRAYAPGDDFRFVDWNAYQRFGRLLVRMYEEQEDLSIYLLVDCSGSMGFAESRKFDQARRLCAALAYVGLANLDRVSVVALGRGTVAPLAATRGKNRIFKILRYLESLQATGTTNLKASLETFVAQHKRRGMVVLLSDLYDPAGFEGGINTLRYNKFEPYVLHLQDAPHQLLQAGIRGDVSIVDCETGERRDVTLTDGLLRRLQEAGQQYRQSVERFCTNARIPYFAAGADEAFDDVVLGILRRGGFLQG